MVDKETQTIIFFELFLCQIIILFAIYKLWVFSAIFLILFLVLLYVVIFTNKTREKNALFSRNTIKILYPLSIILFSFGFICVLFVAVLSFLDYKQYGLVISPNQPSEPIIPNITTNIQKTTNKDIGNISPIEQTITTDIQNITPNEQKTITADIENISTNEPTITTDIENITPNEPIITTDIENINEPIISTDIENITPNIPLETEKKTSDIEQSINMWQGPVLGTLDTIYMTHDDKQFYGPIRWLLIERTGSVTRTLLPYDLQFEEVWFYIATNYNINDDEWKKDEETINATVTKFCKRYMIDEYNWINFRFETEIDQKNSPIYKKIVNAYNTRAFKYQTFAQWMLDAAYMEIPIILDMSFGYLLATLVVLKKKEIKDDFMSHVMGEIQRFQNLAHLSNQATDVQTQQQYIKELLLGITTLVTKYRDLLAKFNTAFNNIAIKNKNLLALQNWFLETEQHDRGNLMEQTTTMVYQFFSDSDVLFE